jgi:hypothetical protein
MAALGLGLFKGSSMPDEGKIPTSPEEMGEPKGAGDEGPESMASQGVMSALEDKDPVAFKDALSTLLESMGYSKTAL